MKKNHDQHLEAKVAECLSEIGEQTDEPLQQFLLGLSRFVSAAIEHEDRVKKVTFAPHGDQADHKALLTKSQTERATWGGVVLLLFQQAINKTVTDALAPGQSNDGN